jgi:glycosyltransferase involved in cell wall biosynthesis
VLEAALSGCALVLGDIASLREVWGDAALYVHPDDHLALRDALARLIADATLRHRLGRRARSRAMRYTPARMARGYIRAYSTSMIRGDNLRPALARSPSPGLRACAS